jgi:hypothetical protein
VETGTEWLAAGVARLEAVTTVGAMAGEWATAGEAGVTRLEPEAPTTVEGLEAMDPYRLTRLRWRTKSAHW